MANHVFVCGGNASRLNWFSQYYNIEKKPTSQVIHFMLDDRFVGRSAFDGFILGNNTTNSDYIWVTDVVDALKHHFINVPYFNVILNKYYKVSIKLLVFIYAKEIMGIDKSLLLDDDIFFLKPLDKWFEYNKIVKTPETLSRMSANIGAMFTEIFGDEFVYADFTKSGKLLNSGTLLYVWNDRLINDVKNYFSSELLYKALVKKFTNDPTWSKRGLIWITEQYFYGIHVSLADPSPLSFGPEIKMLGYPKNDEYKFEYNMMKLPAVLHFIPSDKERNFKYWKVIIQKYCDKHGIEIEKYNAK